jgi:hypothetical protein
MLCQSKILVLCISSTRFAIRRLNEGRIPRRMKSSTIQPVELFIPHPINHPLVPSHLDGRLDLVKGNGRRGDTVDSVLWRPGVFPLKPVVLSANVAPYTRSSARCPRMGTVIALTSARGPTSLSKNRLSSFSSLASYPVTFKYRCWQSAMRTSSADLTFRL